MPTKSSQLSGRKTSFSDAVKAVVRNIPKGKVLSYKEVGKLAGNEKASRAVASIMKANYDPEIPCHRVIRSDGSLGGYNRGGTAAKRVILESELR